MVVIRSLHREDTQGRKVRPFPIFNTQETNMPYRYEFLSAYLDTSKDLNEINIPSEHTALDLEALRVSCLDFLVHNAARREYMRNNGLSEASEAPEYFPELPYRPADYAEPPPAPAGLLARVKKRQRGMGYGKEDL